MGANIAKGNARSQMAAMKMATVFVEAMGKTEPELTPAKVMVRESSADNVISLVPPNT
jgi:hypothetical protein